MRGVVLRVGRCGGDQLGRARGRGRGLVAALARYPTPGCARPWESGGGRRARRGVDYPCSRGVGLAIPGTRAVLPDQVRTKPTGGYTPGTRRYSSRVDRRRAMLGTMSVQDLDETDWAPAGWEPQDVSALDDSPFGSVLSGSMIYDVSVLDPTPGWQPEDDVATEPAAPGDQNPTPPPPSRRTAAPATASRRTTVPQARRTASRLAAQRSTAPGGAVPGTSGRAPARPPGPRLAGAGGPPRLPGPASWGQTGVSGSPWAPPGTDPRLVTRAAQRPAAPQPYAPGAPSGAYGYGRGPGSGRGPSRVPGSRYGQAPAPQTRQAATWQPANRAAGTVGSPYASPRITPSSDHGSWYTGLWIVIVLVFLAIMRAVLS